jgi:hypothetical protein
MTAREGSSETTEPIQPSRGRIRSIKSRFVLKGGMGPVYYSVLKKVKLVRHIS